MTASKYAKQAGLKSLAEAGRLSNTSPDGLTRMHKNNPRRFEAIILGCVEIKRREAASSAPMIEAGRYIMATVKIVDGVPVARFEPA